MTQLDAGPVVLLSAQDLRQNGPMRRLARSDRYRVLVVLLVLALGTAYLLHAGAAGVGIATVLTLPVTILSTMAGKPGYAELDAAARDLARRVNKQEADQLQQLLADSGWPQPADVAYESPELVRWRSDGGHVTGSLAGIRDFYATLEHGRLLILGAAGAGKSVLASQLVLDLTKPSQPQGPPSDASRVVPVRLSMPDFSMGKQPESLQPDEVHDKLEAWIIATVRASSGSRAAVATALVRQGWILPVLDGLDEMDDDAGPPTRAAAVIRALNRPTGFGPGRVVVACREDRYRQLAALPADAGQAPVLQDVTAVVIQPLTPDQVKDYLAHRFPAPALSAQHMAESRWRPVLDAIGDSSSPTAQTLRSPLFLFLAVTAFQDPASDPAELTGRSRHDLEAFLLSRLVPASVRRYPLPDRGHYAPAEVTTWLSTLASHVRDAAVRGPGLDIGQALWSVTDKQAIRKSAALVGFLAALPLGITAANMLNVRQYQNCLLFLLFAFFIFVIGESRASNSKLNTLRSAGPRLRDRPARRRFGRGLAVALAGGFVFGALHANQPVTSGQAGHPLVSGTIGAFGIAAAFVAVFCIYHREPTTAAIRRPSQSTFRGVANYVVTIVAGSVAGALCLAAPTWGTSSFIPASYWGLGIGFTGVMLWVADSAWPRYMIATRFLGESGRLPKRLTPFLDWAYAAGILRVSGTAIQFRHRELQDYLARPDSGTQEPLAAGERSG